MTPEEREAHLIELRDQITDAITAEAFIHQVNTYFVTDYATQYIHQFPNLKLSENDSAYYLFRVMKTLRPLGLLQGIAHNTQGFGTFASLARPYF